MTPAQQATWKKAIMTIIGLIVAAILGWLSGCSAEWTPAGGKVNFLWPDRDVELRVTVDGSTTRPADPEP